MDPGRRLDEDSWGSGRQYESIDKVALSLALAASCPGRKPHRVILLPGKRPGACFALPGKHRPSARGPYPTVSATNRDTNRDRVSGKDPEFLTLPLFPYGGLSGAGPPAGGFVPEREQAWDAPQVAFNGRPGA